jgi:hypothetical protein
MIGKDLGEQALLDAPELGPVADVVSLYQAVQAQRIVPISTVTLAIVLVFHSFYRWSPSLLCKYRSGSCC